MTGPKRPFVPDTTARSMRELKQDFAQSDRDHDGRINLGEFKEFLAGLDAAMSEEEARLGFHEIDSDRDGRISLEEFTRWWDNE